MSALSSGRPVLAAGEGRQSPGPGLRPEPAYLIHGASWLNASAPLLLLALVLLLAPLLTPWNAVRPDWEHALSPPDWATRHLLGTDAIGRDVLALALAAARSSLLVAGAAALLGLGGGVLLGGFVGWRGGWLDTMLTRVLAVAQSLPLLLIAVMVLALYDSGFLALVVLLAVYTGLDVARLARARVRELRFQPFCTATRLLGLSEQRAFLRHVLPNLKPLLPAALLLAVPQAILIESFLGFLGLGPGSAGMSLGGLLAEGMQDVNLAPWLLLTPAAILLWLLLGLARLAQFFAVPVRA